ncbi:hypothetical protein [Actinomadura decatromicini]|uniref:hypothetical protein n=1 Tax=Actinomadura decatromicini TaxID=2604572 RepID=UPI001652F21D|nr:hypothetical protein [Actinomadura decatromicini]
MDEPPRPAGTPETAAARPGPAPRLDVGRPVPVRLGGDLTARVDAARLDGESRAAAIRRLLGERLGGPALTRASARRALLGIGAGLAGGEPVTGAPAHHRALATLLDDGGPALAMRPTVDGVAETVENGVEHLVGLLAEDDADRDRMRQIIWRDLAERAAKWAGSDAEWAGPDAESEEADAESETSAAEASALGSEAPGAGSEEPAD